jgi:Tol biopolymer transport system component
MLIPSRLLVVSLLGLAAAGCLSSAPAPSVSIPNSADAAAGDSARLFGDGIFSTGDYELTPTFTRDGATAYWSVSTPVYGRMRFIMQSRRVDGRWTAPEVAPFSGRWDDVDPFISPDGARLYFLSRRPIGGAAPRNDLDIWVMERSGDAWGEPRHLGVQEHYVTATTDGTLYISAVRADSRGTGDVYRVRRVNGEYEEPENLAALNAPELHDTTPLVAPDESWIIFGSRGRPGGIGDIDLYVSFRGADGGWSPPRNLGPAVNSSATDYCPLLSPDGEWLYFASTRHAFARAFDAPLRGDSLRRLLRGPGNMLGDVYRVRLAPVLARARGAAP